MSSLTKSRGDGYLPTGAAGPVAGPPAEGGPLPPPSGVEGGSGALGRVPVLLVLHVLGGPLGSHGCEPRGLGRPWGLIVLGLAACAAPQALPLFGLCQPPTRGHDPQLAAPPAGGPAGLAVAPGLLGGLGQVGQGAGLDAGAGGSLLGVLAVHYEAFAGRALAASPDHRLRCARLPLQERTQVLRKETGLIERHMF